MVKYSVGQKSTNFRVDIGEVFPGNRNVPFYKLVHFRVFPRQEVFYQTKSTVL